MTRTEAEQPRIAIIGAGLAGVTLASLLAKHAKVEVFEKSRGLGGRMATRHAGTVDFDHGAQYFTIRDPAFHALLEPALDAGVVQAWNRPLHRIDAEGKLDVLPDRSARFVAQPAQTALAKFLARSLTVTRDTKITGIEGGPGRWWLMTERGESFEPFQWVISTAPAPQTLALLPLDPDDASAVQNVRMSGCFTLMLPLPQGFTLPFSAAQVEHPVLSWIAANHTKPERGAAPAIVVHSNNAWAETHLEADLGWVKARMATALLALLPTLPPAALDSGILHRWRYASVEQPLGKPFLLDADRQIAACGDWCIGNRVEAAFQSAAALAETLLAEFERSAV